MTKNWTRLKTEIQKIVDNLKFEEAQDETLKKAKETIKNFEDIMKSEALA